MGLLSKFSRGFTGFFNRESVPKPVSKRAFEMAQVTRLTADWKTATASVDSDLQSVIGPFIARSRDLEQNNTYGRKFGSILDNNVVGHRGVGMQMKVRDTGGNLDTTANRIIESAWKRWGKRKNCTVQRTLSWLDVQHLVLRRCAFDGSVLIRLIKKRSKTNPFHFALQIIEADYLDVNYTVAVNEFGNQVRMGVELDRDTFEPVAYHILQHHPSDIVQSARLNNWRVRVPAEEIIHLYVVERVNQTIGVPWLCASGLPLRMLGTYEMAELTAARAEACKGGYFESENGEEYEGEEEDKEGNIVDKMEPGVIKQLPKGVKFSPHDPTHPNGNLESFRRAMLMSAGAGSGLDYPTLGNDLTGVNYSSGRLGRIETQEGHMAIQEWFISAFVELVFEAWLEWTLSLSQELKPLPVEKFAKFNQPVWLPRRWGYIDPLKDAQADVLSIEKGLNSRRRVLAEQGLDIEEIDEENADDQARTNALGLDYSGKTETETMPPDEEDPDGKVASKVDNVSNGKKSA